MSVRGRRIKIKDVQKGEIGDLMRSASPSPETKVEPVVKLNEDLDFIISTLSEKLEKNNNRKTAKQQRMGKLVE